MPMNILVVWYNDKSVCSGLEWINIYFIKDKTLNNCVWVWSSVDIQLPNIPNWMKRENGKNDRYE